MSFPCFLNKQLLPALISPDDFIRYKQAIGKFTSEEIPDGAILYYQSSLQKAIPRKYQPKKQAPSHQVIQLDDRLIGLSHVHGVGAPAAVIVLEEMIAQGIKKFISIGTAGSLNAALKIGDFVVCDQAIRDEGTSYHYLTPSKYASAATEIVTGFETIFRKHQQSFHRGASWTTDAPYRETRAELIHYQREGILTVDMEASALFAVAQYRGVKMGAAFIVSDSLSQSKWEPHFHSRIVKDNLKILFEFACEVLTTI